MSRVLRFLVYKSSGWQFKGSKRYVHWFVAHRLTRLESCSTRERDPRDVHRFSRISRLPSTRSSSRKFRALAGKNGEVSSSPGNRATFAELPRLFGDSCANLFRARNPICLRLIVLLPLPFPAAHSSRFTGAVASPRIIATLQWSSGVFPNFLV